MDFGEPSDESPEYEKLATEAEITIETKPRNQLWLRLMLAALVLICIITAGVSGYFLLKSNQNIPDPAATVDDNKKAVITVQPSNDMIYLIGGVDEKGRALDTVQVYDPSSEESIKILPSKLQIARHSHVAGVLNGRVIVAGGQDSKGNTLKSTEVYEPDLGWVFGPNLQLGRKRAAGAVMGNGFYICCGENDLGRLSWCDYIKSIEQGWMSPTGLSTKSGLSPASAAFVDNHFFLMGKNTDGHVWLMNYADGQFHRKTDVVNIGVESLAMTIIDDLVVVCEDELNGTDPTPKCAQYNTTSNAEMKLWPPMQTPRLHVALVNYNGTVFALGGAILVPIYHKWGIVASSQVESSEIFHREFGWEFGPNLLVERKRAAGVVLGGNRFYVCVGENDHDTIDTCENLDLAERRWLHIHRSFSQNRSVTCNCGTHRQPIYLVGQAC